MSLFPVYVRKYAGKLFLSVLPLSLLILSGLAPGVCAAVSFGTAADFGTGQDPRYVATGDFNGDGKKDIVAANYNSNTISVLLANGDGTYQPAVNYTVGSNPKAVVIGDFNGDGKPDLAVANSNYASNIVSILTGNGDGTFQALLNVTVESAPGALAVGDFNGDGRLDLAVANGSNNISILLGNGNATFQSAVNYSVGSSPSSIAVADFEGDGTLDLALANYNDYTVSILKGNGNGTFRAGMSYSVSNKPSSVAAVDLNRDGRCDLVVSNYFGGSVTVLLGIGGGDFQPSTTFPTAGYPGSVAIGDFNGDGIPDVAVARNGVSSNNIVILLGNGSGDFSSVINVQADNTGSYGIAADDMNNDGKPDLVVGYYANTNISVLLNMSDFEASGAFSQVATYTTGTSPAAAVSPDLNNDGRADLAVANSGSNTVSVFSGNGDGNFTPQGEYVTGSEPRALATGELNRDGKIDLITANRIGGTVSVLLGTGNGSFAQGVDYAAGSLPTDVVLGDFNRDGKPDLAVANSGSDTISILLGNGDGTFQPGIAYGVAAGPLTLMARDLNGDEKLDIAAVNRENSSVSILLSNGDGTFQSVVNYAAGEEPYCVAMGDFNHDGKIDLAIGGTFNTSILLGNGDGTFAPAVLSPIANHSLITNDFNRDGNIDMAGDSTILMGNNDGTFQSAITYPVGGNAGTSADFNGDGKPDLAVVNDMNGGASGMASILLNLAPDMTPDTFSFVDQTNVSPSTLVTSNSITVAGINSLSPVSIAGGEYSINGEAYTSAEGSVNNGDTVTVRQTSSPNYSTRTEAILTIGGVSGTFSVTTYSGADLIVSSVGAPSTAAAGGTITIIDTTRNNGAGPSGTSTTGFYLSSNSTYESSDVLLGSRSIVSLAAGSSSFGSTSVTIPAGTIAGNYYIIAVADSGGTESETNETNNWRASPAILIGTDLTVMFVAAPSKAAAGAAVTISDTTRNNGAGPSGTSTTGFYLSSDSTYESSDVLLGSRSIVSLATGSSSFGSTSVTIPAGTIAGNYYIIAVADSGGTESETNETNNWRASPAILIGTDLTVMFVAAPSKAAAGAAIIISDTTRNNGAGPSGTSITSFYLSSNLTYESSDVLVGSRSVGPLAAGASSVGNTSVTIPAGTIAGNYYIIAVADSGGTESETNETNNWRASPAILIGTDLTVMFVAAPSKAAAGAAIIISDTTRNNGAGPSGTSITSFYLSSNLTYESSDVLVGSRSVGPLAAGASSVGNTSVTIPAGTIAGNYYIIAAADSGGTESETNETNNWRASPAILIGTDLTVTSVDGPSTAAAGETVIITDTTENSGAGSSGTSVTSLYLSTDFQYDEADVLLGSRAIDSLAAGAISVGSTSVTIPAGTVAGNYYIIVVADSGGTESEANEINNSKEWSFTVSGI